MKIVHTLPLLFSLATLVACGGDVASGGESSGASSATGIAGDAATPTADAGETKATGAAGTTTCPSHGDLGLWLGADGGNQIPSVCSNDGACADNGPDPGVTGNDADAGFIGTTCEPCYPYLCGGSSPGPLATCAGKPAVYPVWMVLAGVKGCGWTYPSCD